MRSEIWFVSDVHLRLDDRPYLDLFLTFLDRAGEACRELWIVGDLFEFWIGDRQAGMAFYRPLFDALARLAHGGTTVHVVHGNRDFLIGGAFERAGCTLEPDESVLELGGRRVHVSHGDQFCIDDVSYQRARVVMRSRPVRAVARLMPGFLGHALARAYRGISERKKARKKAVTGNRFHTVEEGIRREFHRGDHDVVLCGHIHDLADRTLRVGDRDRRVLTTGAWEEDGPNWVAFDGTDLHLHGVRGAGTG